MHRLLAVLAALAAAGKPATRTLAAAVTRTARGLAAALAPAARTRATRALAAAVTPTARGLAAALVLAAGTRATRALAAALVLAAFLAGCGSGGGSAKPPTLSVALDFTPNAVHAPIYTAIRDGLDRREGVRLAIRTPGASPDSLKTVLSGRADLGVLDIHDLGLAVAQGRDVVAVGALVQRPLAAIITRASVRRPRNLEGRRVGVSGLPSDPAVLRAVLEHDGASLAKVHQVTIGFAAVQSLVSGRIDGVPAFWNAEGVTLRQRGFPIHEFRVDDYGAPRYPEVVLVVRRDTLRTRGAAVRSAVRAIAAGMRDVREHPGPAAAEIARAGGTEVPLARAQIDAVTPIYGTALRRNVLEAWSAWDARFGILPRRVDVARAFALG